jgi:hypothetical protein
MTPLQPDTLVLLKEKKERKKERKKGTHAHRVPIQ